MTCTLRHWVLKLNGYKSVNCQRVNKCGCRDLNPSRQLGKLQSYRTRLQPQQLPAIQDSLLHRDSSFDIETLLSTLKRYFRILSPSTTNPMLESSRMRASFQLLRSSKATNFIPSKSLVISKFGNSLKKTSTLPLPSLPNR